MVVGVLELMLLESSRKVCLQERCKTDEHTEEKAGTGQMLTMFWANRDKAATCG